MTFNEQNHDELYHRSHRYIKKIGNRYFYTAEELKAFYNKTKDRATGEDKAKAYENVARKARIEADANRGYASGTRRMVSADKRHLQKNGSMMTQKEYDDTKKRIDNRTQWAKNAEGNRGKAIMKALDAERKAREARENSVVGKSKRQLERTGSAVANAKNNAVSSIRDAKKNRKQNVQKFIDNNFGRVDTSGAKKVGGVYVQSSSTQLGNAQYKNANGEWQNAGKPSQTTTSNKSTQKKKKKSRYTTTHTTRLG